MAQPKINWYEPTNRIEQTTKDGIPCWKFSILKSDPPLPWDIANKNYGPGGRSMNPPQVNRRAEMSFAAADPRFKPDGPFNLKDGMIQSHGIRMYFDLGWPINKSVQHDWKMLWQLHNPDTYQGNQFDGFHGISEHNGFIDLVNPNDPNGGTFYHSPVQTGKWGPHDYYLVIKASSKQDGYVKIADANKKILSQWNGQTFPTGAGGGYMYGPLIGLYMDGISLTSDAILYIAGFEGPLPDIWDGDVTLGAVVPAATPTPPVTAVAVPPAPKWIQDLRDDLKAQLLQDDAAVTLATLRRDGTQHALDTLQTKLNSGEKWLE